MGYRIKHIHLKAPDPRKTAEWYVKAFDFQIVTDEVRIFGDRFVGRQGADGGIAVARTNEQMGQGDASPHHGLEHFGFDSTDLDADIARLTGLGAKLLEGPTQVLDGHGSRSCTVPTARVSSSWRRGRSRAGPAPAARPRRP